MPPGKRIEASDLTTKRPGTGIAPTSYNDLIGLVAKETIDEDTVLQWGLFGD
ncbi:SAF domain-containing protein [Lentibacter algarum]|uniref:SAF domain-containing protein n=1 Tax=Lentibacter algarum TaxID=576131 RepID=UPI003AF88315